MRVALPNCYADGDELKLVYWSGEHKGHREAKSYACREILMILLTNRPKGVHMHANTVKNGDRVREAARALQRASLQAQGYQVPGISAGIPLPVGWSECFNAPARERPTASCSLRAAYVAPTNETEEQDRLRRLSDLLESLPKNTWLHPHRSTPALWQELSRLVPPGGLKAYFQSSPARFCVEPDAMERGVWKFMLLPGVSAGGDGQQQQQQVAAAPAAATAAVPDHKPPQQVAAALAGTSTAAGSLLQDADGFVVVLPQGVSAGGDGEHATAASSSADGWQPPPQHGWHGWHGWHGRWNWQGWTQGDTAG